MEIPYCFFDGSQDRIGEQRTKHHTEIPRYTLVSVKMPTWDLIGQAKEIMAEWSFITPAVDQCNRDMYNFCTDPWITKVSNAETVKHRWVEKIKYLN